MYVSCSSDLTYNTQYENATFENREVATIVETDIPNDRTTFRWSLQDQSTITLINHGE